MQITPAIIKVTLDRGPTLWPYNMFWSRQSPAPKADNLVRRDVNHHTRPNSVAAKSNYFVPVPLPVVWDVLPPPRRVSRRS